MEKWPIVAISLVLALAAIADVPDCTGSMQFLCNPNKSRWSTTSANDGRSRAMTTIVPYKGKLYVSGGCWDPNMGWAPIFAVDPVDGSYVREYQAGSERFDYFREDSAGRLYAPVTDQHEDGPNWGALFRKDLDGEWKCLKNIPRGSHPSGLWGTLDNQGYAIHTWDLCCWKGKVFTAGYGIAYGPEGSNDMMRDATPCTSTNYTASGTPRRFKAFLPFEDDLFCLPFNTTSYPFEEWRFNQSTGEFICEERPWSEIAPDFTSADRAISSGSYSAPCLTTPYKNRVVYILGYEHVDAPKPLCLYSAENVNHHIKATKVNLGLGVFPFCISKYTTRHGDEILNILAAEFDSADRTIVNSVWESRDGLSFEKLFTFKTVQQASAIARTDEGFFVGIGWRFATGWNLACKAGSSGNAGDDVSGDIYKISFSRVYRPMELGRAVSVVKDNGTSARLSVTVTCLEAPSASLALALTGATVTNWENVVEGETYSLTVPTVQGRAYDFAFTGTPAGYPAVMSAGAFSSAKIDGWFIVDFDDPGYKAGDGWTDVTDVNNPGGTWSKGGNAAVLVDASAHVPRHVEIDGDDEVVYTPTTSSEAGADVCISGRVAIAASDISYASSDNGLIVSLFFAVTNGEIRACGYANGAWTVFDAPGTALDSGAWTDYEIEIDLNSSAAPRAQYRLGGEPLVAATCPDGWLALESAPQSISSISYRGTGGVAGFSGETRAKVIATLPVPVIGGGGESGVGGNGGLAFGTDTVTGSATFTATVSNPVAGAWYTAFTSETLDLGAFRAECVVQAKDGDEVIPLGVDATPSTKFVKIVVSPTPFAVGDPLPEE